MRERLRQFVEDENAQDLVEYALLCACIALSCVSALNLLGDTISGLFSTVADQLVDE